MYTYNCLIDIIILKHIYHNPNRFYGCLLKLRGDFKIQNLFAKLISSFISFKILRPYEALLGNLEFNKSTDFIRKTKYFASL